MTTPIHPSLVNENIAHFEEYRNFKYSFDFATITTLVSFVFFIPSVYCTLKTLLFYLKFPRTSVSSNGIHPHIFKSFITMQVWNNLNLALDFIVVRIPSTTIFTSTCVMLAPDTFFRFVSASMFFTFINAQFFTVLFCLIRVLILYSLFNQDKRCKNLFIGWSIFTYFFSVCDSTPNFFSKILCVQLDAPFQEGAILTVNEIRFTNPVLIMAHFWLSFSITLIILVTTGLVIIKLRNNDTRTTINQSIIRNKAERILTITTILIIIPLIYTQCLAISRSQNNSYFGYFMIIRPLVLDLRVTAVSIYFYMTQPMFKKKQSTRDGANALRTIGSAVS